MSASSSVPPMILSGLEPLIVGEGTLFVNIGERTNVTGSAKFRKLIEADDYVGALDVARHAFQAGGRIVELLDQILRNLGNTGQGVQLGEQTLYVHGNSDRDERCSDGG